MKTYPSKIIVSNKRRNKYYVNDSYKGVMGSRNIPPTFLSNPKYEFAEDGILVYKENNLPVLANPRTAGKPKYWVVNFQDIYNGKISEQSRNNYIKKLKEYFIPIIESLKVVILSIEYPLEFYIVICDLEMPIDISNKGVIYHKIIEDLLVEYQIIPDDSIQYINCSGRTKFIKVEKEEDIRMEIFLLQSDNEI